MTERWWRLIDTVDEWAHRRGLATINGAAWGWWRFTPFALLCNHRERGLIGRDAFRAAAANPTATEDDTVYFDFVNRRTYVLPRPTGNCLAYTVTWNLKELA